MEVTEGESVLAARGDGRVLEVEARGAVQMRAHQCDVRAATGAGADHRSQVDALETLGEVQDF